MELSARNQLKGKVSEVNLGMITASIKIEVEDPTTITAVITKESAEKLGLKEGDDVKAIIKSTEIIVGK
ncbi:MAG: TOBE domain-containing protein [Methanobrevibacter sp.]|uniref:TOBE domain-containing protein n=1 Tax=Methanobrevibacter sp. TaxID=66852 RepID=UPI0026DF16E2|nr:TOBE domain-containing protein [Methanobrevibacter sp.]MDO5849210.1 TOBE domain-containing protein [Methanobrevibacter sp.]